MSDKYLKILPQNKEHALQVLRYLSHGYFEVTEKEFEETEKEENLNIHHNQSLVIARKILLKRICYPILQNLVEPDKETKMFFEYSWGKRYLSQAEDAYKHGLLSANIILCRCALETGLREVISRVKEIRNKTSFLTEYKALENEQFKGTIKQATSNEINLLKQGELEKIFLKFSPFLEKSMFYSLKKSDGYTLRKILDWFVHASYSDLYVTVEDVPIDGKLEHKNWEDFLQKLVAERKDLDEFTKDTHRRWHYSSMVINDELCLYFLQVVFETFRRIYFENLPRMTQN